MKIENNTLSKVNNDENKIKQMKLKYNLTQKQLSDIVGISRRTIENWESKRRTAPAYLLNLIEFVLENTIGCPQKKNYNVLPKMTEDENKIKQMKLKYNLTQKQLSDIVGIPKRTIENWESKQKIAPEYLLNLIEFFLENTIDCPQKKND